jgi:hypothetical protein
LRGRLRERVGHWRVWGRGMGMVELAPGACAGMDRRPSSRAAAWWRRGGCYILTGACGTRTGFARRSPACVATESTNDQLSVDRVSGNIVPAMSQSGMMIRRNHHALE